MFFIDDLTSLKVYPSTKRIYIPVDENDKQHNAAIMLLSPNKENSLKLMLNPITVNRRNYFSYFSDKSVEAIINHEGMIDQTNTDAINESANNPFKDVKTIVDSLSKEDLKRICNGEFKDSPCTIYRNIRHDNGVPAAFIDVYMLRGTSYGTIVMATNPKYRGKGYAHELVSTMLDYFKSNDTMVNELHWETQYDNTISIDMAKKFNFNTSSRSLKTFELVYHITKSVKESKLSSKERSKLPDSAFGLPKKRKYPLNDKEHVLSAIRMFNYVDVEDEGELARNIKFKITTFNMEDEVVINMGNRLHKYTRAKKKKALNESIIFKDDLYNTKFEYVVSNVDDIAYISKILNSAMLKELYNKLGNDKDAKLKNRTVKVFMYKSESDIPHNKDPYAIYCLDHYAFNSDKYGPYELYIKNLLSSIIIYNMNPEVNKYIETYVSIWMADQIDVFKGRSDVYWNGSYAVKQLYDAKGVNSIRRLIKTNDTTEMNKIAFKYWVKSLVELLPYQEEMLDKAMRDDILNENVNKKELSFETPEELHKWMRSNIKYKDFTKLMTPQELLEEGSGSCHDQTLFVYHYLSKMKNIENIRKMFLIEYKDGSEQGGVTHSFVYYTKNNKVYWFESAWGGQDKKIHGPYDSVNDIKKNILDHYENSKMGDYNKFGKIEFSSFKGKPGMSLDEVVQASLK